MAALRARVGEYGPEVKPTNAPQLVAPFAAWVRRSVEGENYTTDGTALYSVKIDAPPGDPIGAFVQIDRPGVPPPDGTVLGWALEMTFTAALRLDIAALPALDMDAGLQLQISTDNIVWESLSTTLSGTYECRMPAELLVEGDVVVSVAMKATRPFSTADAQLAAPVFCRVAWGANRPVGMNSAEEGESGGWDLKANWILIQPTL